VNLTALYHGGAYGRDVDGTWRYAATDTRVPGACDICLADVVPHFLVGPPIHGQVWVARPFALTTEAFKAVLDELADTPPSFNLPERIPELPNTTSVILVPHRVWARHENDVVAMNAPELHPSALMTLDMVATAAGLSAASLTEYIRRGTCPPPQIQLGRSPMWSRSVVSHWLSTRSSHQVQVSCGGCGEPTEVEGLMVDKSSGDLGLFPLCASCQVRLMHQLADHPVSGPVTIEMVESLLRAQRG